MMSTSLLLYSTLEVYNILTCNTLFPVWDQEQDQNVPEVGQEAQGLQNGPIGENPSLFFFFPKCVVNNCLGSF